MKHKVNVLLFILINHDTVRKPVRVVRGLLISKSCLGYVSSYVNTEVFVANKLPTNLVLFWTNFLQTGNFNKILFYLIGIYECDKYLLTPKQEDSNVINPLHQLNPNT